MADADFSPGIMRSILVRAPWFLLLAACGSSADPGASRPTATAKVVARPGAAPPPQPVHGTHGSSIVRIAATDDGRAAVTADQKGGIRLWPALDGTREPIVVFAAEPNALALAHDGDGFVIADHDGARGVELIRIAGTGKVLGRTMLAGDAPVEQVELTSAGALVLRTDQSLELVDATGTSRARVVPDPGTRIRALAQRAGRVLAIIDRDAVVTGRWVELAEGRATWGAVTPALPIDPARAIALSPDHQHLIGVLPNSHLPVLVDLATGTPAKRSICTLDQARPSDGGELKDPFGDRADLSPTPLGFFDAKTIACSISSQLVWWSTSGDQITPKHADNVNTAGVEVAVADHLVTGGLGHQLGLYTPDGPRYLGYGFRELTHLRIAPTGVVIGKGDQQPLLLDDGLHQRARYVLPKANADWTDLIPLDDRYLLTTSTRPMSEDSWGNAYQVSIFDTQTNTMHQRLPNRASSNELAFEPSTQLLVSSDGLTSLLLRFDPATHSFAERIEIAGKPILKGLYLTDPQRADGVIAIAIRDDDGGIVVDELYGEDLRGGTLAPRTSHRLTGQLRAIDRAGQVYVHAPRDKDDVVVYRHGMATAKLAGLATAALHPSDDGTRVAAFGSARISLSTSGGALLWQTAAWGASDIGWTPGGALFARFPGALAKLDPETGALTERQCGWAFGLSVTPFETSANAPIVCDVAP
jgi:hypothetical protein